MTEEVKVTYVVLTERPNCHYVAVRRNDETAAWLQIIAVFRSRGRAENYAEVENMFIDEGMATKDDLGVVEPQYAEPETGIGRIAVKADGGSAPQAGVAKPNLSISSPAHLSRLKSLADEILEVLPELLTNFDKGPTAQNISAHLNATEYDVRRAMKELHSSGRALLMRRSETHGYHLVPNDYSPPLEPLTEPQKVILGVMLRAAGADGMAALTNRQIADASGIAVPTVSTSVSSLARKRRIVEVTRGFGTSPSTYQIIDAADAAQPNERTSDAQA